MSEYPLIGDLAFILITAGVTSVICRFLKLPILVGYLLAGVIAGPYVPLFPDVHDMMNIKTWSEIGVIFILFALGLEFNFKNLLKVGKTGVITVGVIMSGMMMCCLGLGHVLGWSTVTSIFMGGILCISSTMVIVKAFEELKLKGKSFTNIVYGIEIFEDILGIFLMVVLSTIAMSQNANIMEEISTTAMRVVFFLVLWFVGGIFLVPTLLRKLKPYLTDEILLVISLALCLGMVMLADASHLSTALGAFTIGSILGATTEAHRIETLMAPIKNLFGAIFFVSIGMMVNPTAILSNLGSLFLLLAFVLFLNPVTGSLGIFLSGKSLRESLRAGACFGQIGEFSFIIANLGVSLKVLDDFTYPVIIAISCITMITTPYWIKYSEKLVEPIARLLPERLKYRVDNERKPRQSVPNRQVVLLKQFLVETFILSMILIGIITLFGGFIEPHFRSFIEARHVDNSEWISRGASFILTLICCMPFLSALILRRNKMNRAFVVVLLRGGKNMIRLLQWIRVAVAAGFITFECLVYSPFPKMISLGIGCIVLLIVAKFEMIFSNYVRIERQFLFNYNEVELMETSADGAESLGSLTDLPAAGGWLSNGIKAASYRVDEDSPFLGKTLMELNLRAKENLFVIHIERGNENINIPSGQERIVLNDRIHIVGSQEALLRLEKPPFNVSEKKLHIASMGEFSKAMQESRTGDTGLRCLCIPIQAHSGLARQTLRSSGIGSRYKCLVIGVETCGRVETSIHPDDIFEEGTRLWVIGERDALVALLEANLIALPQPTEGTAQPA